MHPPRLCSLMRANMKRNIHIRSRKALRLKNDPNLLNANHYPYHRVLLFLFGRSRYGESVENLKEMAYYLARLVSRQCKVHTGQKLNQSLQFYSFYSRIWGEEMTSKMITGVRRTLICHGRNLILSAVCLIPYDWKKNKIADEKLENSIRELSSVGELCQATVFCESCQKRQVIDKKLPNVDYCYCNGSVGYTDQSRKYESWEPFLERENILVWRKKHDTQSLFMYKVYGTYDDMSLSAFMEVQLNTDFRTKWDTTALELRIVDSQPRTNSDLIYWRVKFPQFFANRDYVFKRRFKVDAEKKEVVIVSEHAEHERLPEIEGIYRVHEYWSIMVLRANRNFHEPGMSYTLTYYDNPGTSLPSPVTSFIATKAFPDYLVRVYRAAMSLQQRWMEGEDIYMSLPQMLRYPERAEIPAVAPPEEELPSKEVTISLSSIPEHFRQNDVSDLPQYKAIKDAFRSSDHAEHQPDMAIPLKFRKVVIDLLEAIEVVTPDLEEKSLLASRIEKLVDKLDLEKGSRSQLLKKLANIRQRTKTFMEKSAKKKEESLKSMNEFEMRRSHYDSASPDERTLLLIQGLFKAISDVVKAEQAMKTGKGFAEPDSAVGFHNSLILKALSQHKKNGNHQSSPREQVHRAANKETVEEKVKCDESKADSESSKGNCECCACLDLRIDEKHSIPLLSEFSFFFASWWRGNRKYNANDGDFCNNCVCEHRRRKSSASFSSDDLSDRFQMKSDPSSEEVKLNTADPSSWMYFNIWSFSSGSLTWLLSYLWPFSSEAACESEETVTGEQELPKEPVGETCKEKLPSGKAEDSSISWYWIPVVKPYNFFVGAV